MKRSVWDIVFTVFKIIVLLVVALYLGYSIFAMTATTGESGWEALGFIVLLAVGLYVNGGAFLVSLVLFILSLSFKKSFIKKADAQAEGYEKCLKIKKRNVLHFSLLMAFAVLAEIAIFVVGSIIF